MPKKMTQLSFAPPLCTGKFEVNTGNLWLQQDFFPGSAVQCITESSDYDKDRSWVRQTLLYAQLAKQTATSTLYQCLSSGMLSLNLHLCYICWTYPRFTVHCIGHAAQQKLMPTSFANPVGISAGDTGKLAEIRRL